MRVRLSSRVEVDDGARACDRVEQRDGHGVRLTARGGWVCSERRSKKGDGCEKLEGAQDRTEQEEPQTPTRFQNGLMFGSVDADKR
jgi:hypothetical protein